MENLSREFKQYLIAPGSWKRIMEHNCAGNETTYPQWRDKRKFIAEAIPSKGTILDIGCAGGFFLRSLIEWTGYELVPFGIDINDSFIREAKRIFPEHPNNFMVLSVRDIDQLSLRGFPKQYDFVYVSIFNPHRNDDIVFVQERILPLATKRLIIGFYGANKFPQNGREWKEERDGIEAGIEKLKKSDLEVSGTLMNPTRFNQAVAWIDIEREQ